jgi:hypothetical protein
MDSTKACDMEQSIRVLGAIDQPVWTFVAAIHQGAINIARRHLGRKEAYEIICSIKEI